MHRLLLLFLLTLGCASAPVPRNLIAEKSAWVLRCAPADVDKPGFVFTPNGTWKLDTQGRKDHGYLFLEHQEEFADFEFPKASRNPPLLKPALPRSKPS